MDNAPRMEPINRSGNHSVTIRGCERQPFIAATSVAIILGFTLMTWWGVVFCIAFWFVCIAVLRYMAKADPIMSRVYMDHMKYRPFYMAKAGLHSRGLKAPKRWE